MEFERGGESSGWGGHDGCLMCGGGGLQSFDGVVTMAVSEVTVVAVTLPLLLLMLLLLLLLFISMPAPPAALPRDSNPLTTPAVNCCAPSSFAAREVCGDDRDGAGSLLVSGTMEAMRIRVLSLTDMKRVREDARWEEENIVVVKDALDEKNTACHSS